MLNPEQPVVATSVKRETTFAMEFLNDRSGSYSGRVFGEPNDPPNGGLTTLNSMGILGVVGGSRMGSGWQSQVSRTDEPPLLRDDLNPAGPGYYTFYAFVGPQTLATGAKVPGHSAGTRYTAYWCGSYTSGIHNGVDCDEANWWDPAHGASSMPRSTWSDLPIGVGKTQNYQLRDIDCHDGRIAPGLHASLIEFSPESACPLTG
jgi:hypothetical protein